MYSNNIEDATSAFLPGRYAFKGFSESTPAFPLWVKELIESPTCPAGLVFDVLSTNTGTASDVQVACIAAGHASVGPWEASEYVKDACAEVKVAAAKREDLDEVSSYNLVCAMSAELKRELVKSPADGLNTWVVDHLVSWGHANPAWVKPLHVTRLAATGDKVSAWYLSKVYGLGNAKFSVLELSGLDSAALKSFFCNKKPDFVNALAGSAEHPELLLNFVQFRHADLDKTAWDNVYSKLLNGSFVESTVSQDAVLSRFNIDVLSSLGTNATPYVRSSTAFKLYSQNLVLQSKDGAIVDVYTALGLPNPKALLKPVFSKYRLEKLQFFKEHLDYLEIVLNYVPPGKISHFLSLMNLQPNVSLEDALNRVFPEGDFLEVSKLDVSF